MATANPAGIPSPNPAPTGFQRVLAKFSTRLTPEEVQDFQFTTLNDVHQVIVNIQEQQARGRGMRNLTRVLRFVEAMDEFGKVVEVFLNTSSLLAFIWGPIKLLLQITSAWADSFDTLLDAYQQIAENIPLLLQYQNLFERNPSMAKILEMMYEDILEFHQSALRMFGRSAFQQFFRAAWKDFKSRFQHILEDLKRHKCLIESQANILQIQQSQAARAAADQDFQRVFLGQRREQYLSTQNWLSAVNMKEIHEGFSNLRREYPSTGQWILKHESIKLWLDPDSSTVSSVWINGILGAGKTILASFLIEQAQQNHMDSVLYFYCKHKDPQRNTFVGVVRSIVSQLLVKTRDTDILPFIFEQSLSSGEMSLSSQQLCNSLLKDAFQNIPRDMKVYIVLDGIDECDSQERRKIASAFSTLFTSINDPGRIRGLFVSQDEPDLKSLLRTATSVKISKIDNEEDIKCYVDHWASKILIKFSLTQYEKETMGKTVCLGADGMFLFAKLVMNNLHTQTNKRQLYRELLPERFPRGLNQAYERVVEGIYQNENGAERAQAQKLLGWLVCSRRPLKWHEVQGAMSIDNELQVVDFEAGSLVLDAGELCGSLVERFPGDRVELVHSTAKKYLIEDNYIRIPQEEGKLAALCLQYLTFESFENETQSDATISQLVKAGFYSFFDYAVLHWVDHLEMFLKTFEARDLNDLEALGPVCEDFAAINAFDTPDSETLQTFELRCEEARSKECFKNIVSLVANARQARASQEDTASLGELGAVLARVRLNFESMIQSGRLTTLETQSLTTYYGSNWFKCPRHLCFYFHQGFHAISSRDQHVNRHDLPFCCSHDGCSRVQTGFSTEKDLKTHLKKNHPDLESLSWKFPKVPKAPAPTDENGKAVARFQCTFCPKRFTRAYALKGHLRTHTDERPFVCTLCGKAFSRQNDRKRHESLHAGERKFVCKGELKHGGRWGCGRKFARADALGQHFYTDAGKICVKPVLDEDAIERQRTRMENRNGQQATELDDFRADDANDNIPATLLAQLPALATLEWAPTDPVVTE